MIGFVHLRHEQCIKSTQAVRIGSGDMNVDCKHSLPCYLPRPTLKVTLVYRVMHIMPNHYPEPGSETFLHGMTMYHLWVVNFLAFFSWKKKYVLRHLKSTDELLNRRENVFCHNSNTNICKQAGIFQTHFPGCLLVCPDINDIVSHHFTVLKEIRWLIPAERRL